MPNLAIRHRMDIEWTSDEYWIDIGWAAVGYRLDIGWTSVGDRLGIGWISGGGFSENYPIPSRSPADPQPLPNRYLAHIYY